MTAALRGLSRFSCPATAPRATRPVIHSRRKLASSLRRIPVSTAKTTHAGSSALITLAASRMAASWAGDMRTSRPWPALGLRMWEHGLSTGSPHSFAAMVYKWEIKARSRRTVLGFAPAFNFASRQAARSEPQRPASDFDASGWVFHKAILDYSARAPFLDGVISRA